MIRFACWLFIGVVKAYISMELKSNNMNSKSIEEAANEIFTLANLSPEKLSLNKIKEIIAQAQEQKPVAKAVDDLIEALKQDDIKNGDCYWANHMIMDFLTQIKEQQHEQ